MLGMSENPEAPMRSGTSHVCAVFRAAPTHSSRRTLQFRAVHRTGKPVLIVEDHDDTRQMVEMFLRHDGYDVCCAANGKAALDFVERTRPCLILLDVMMPVMDGPTFAHLLRAHSDQVLAQTPIVLLTAVPDADRIQQEVGAVAVIGKPVDFDSVIAAVETHCPLRQRD
jgi:CheY-like chemotaxis protein